ncbi:hypothetical protein C0J52_19731 [Blattella germanica]|nr:hypothetical protein C0J52_19731 [Blattella germanica]
MVCNDNLMGITQIKERYNRFKCGHTSVESKSRSSQPSTDQVNTGEVGPLCHCLWSSACPVRL